MTTVLCEISLAVEPLRARFPEVEFIDISESLPEGVRGDILFGGVGDHSAEAIARGVRWVQLSFTGIDHAPTATLRAEIVTTARGAGAIPIAEYVMASLLASSRDFPRHWLREAPERWNFQRTSALYGQNLAVLGFGGIGRRVATLAEAFNMNVIATRRHESQGRDGHVTLVRTISELVANADHLVLCAPLTSETRHIINDDVLHLVRPGVHLVNIARGGLVDQDALRHALDEGRVRRASLDVTDPEPLPEGHWLYSHPQVFLTPHSSWTGTPFFSGAIDIFADNLARYLANEPLEGVIDRELGY